MIDAMVPEIKLFDVAFFFYFVYYSNYFFSSSAFRIIPSRLQLFEYESVSFTCEGFNVSAGWKVRNIKEFISKCSNGEVTTKITCTIDYAFVPDSGGYWCEGGGGSRSNTVNIIVTGIYR